MRIPIAWLVCAGAAFGAAAALAEPRPLNEAELRALVAGKTVHYSFQGEFYGSEAYPPAGQKVHWRWGDTGECERGVWTPSGEKPATFCYQYETDFAPLCWVFLEHDDGQVVSYVAGDDGMPKDMNEAYPVIAIDEERLDCEATGQAMRAPMMMEAG